MKKKEKIVMTSLELFNERGVNNVSTNHIAEYLTMSAGNLYYYFANKDEIINDIFDLYSSELKERFERNVSLDEKSIDVFSAYMDTVFILMWKYRFFYLNMFTLLQKNAILNEKYEVLRQKLSHNIRVLIEHFIDGGLIFLEENDIDPFVENLKLHVSCWMNYEVTFSENSEITKKSMYNAIMKIIFYFKLVSTESGKTALTNLERKYLEKMMISTMSGRLSTFA